MVDFNGSTPRPTQPTVASRRVLVVDDNEDAAESIALLLSMGGHQVRVELNGPAALAAFPEFQPDVVLLDIGLPEIDGYEVARRLRDGQDGRELLLIALTGYGREEDVQRSREAGFDHHMVKPVDFPQLEALVGGR
jgi:CheY-like chemotaxis protein